MNPKEIPRGLMLTIEQVSSLMGVDKQTLRYWESYYSPYLKVARTPSNRRKYSFEDLERIRTVKHLLKEEYLTPRGVLRRLKELFPQICNETYANKTNHKQETGAR